MHGTGERNVDYMGAEKDCKSQAKELRQTGRVWASIIWKAERKQKEKVILRRKDKHQVQNKIYIQTVCVKRSHTLSGKSI